MRAATRLHPSNSTTAANASCGHASTLNTACHQLLSRRSQGSCPALFLAPMENLMDRSTRLSLFETLTHHGLGTFDEACTEFIRVPAKSNHPLATVKGLTTEYSASELAPVPLAAQLMGSSTELLAAAAQHLVEVKGAPRIDLNCGCPANVVTGGGAGSSLLKDPQQLQQVVAALVAAVGHQVPVSVKMRSGFMDTSLFRENLFAVQEAGAAFVTLHPRTKQQAYSGRADWSLIALAKELLDIPVVGNGDVICVSSALSLLHETGCDGIMVGRGALQDPLLFHRIRSHFGHTTSYNMSHTSGHTAGHTSSQTQASLGEPAAIQQPAVQQQMQQQQQLWQADYLAQHQQQPVLQQQDHHLQQQHCADVDEASVVIDFLQRYAACGWKGSAGGAREASQSGRIGRLKKVMKYLFSGQPDLRLSCEQLLRVQPNQVSAEHLLQDMTQQVLLHWQPGGPSERTLISHMSMPGKSKAAAQQAAPVGS